MGILSNWLEKRIDLSDMKSAETIIGSIEDRLSTKALAFHLATSYIADTISKCEIKRYVNGELVKDRLYYLYVADSFSHDYHPIKGDKFTNISLDNETKTFTKKASDVFYFKLDDGKLKTLINSMLEDYSEILKYSIDSYKSSNDDKYKLVLDEVKVGDKEFNENFEKVIKKQLEAFINNSKVVYPQFKGQNLERVSKGDGKTDSTDIRNIRKEIFEATAEAFKMPISMLYGNITNVNDIVSSYVTFRIDPLAKMISEELTRKTSAMEDYEKGTYVDVDTTNVLHTDIFAIADKIDKLIASGIYCVDEIRDKLGDSKLNTDFSKQHWITKNYSTIENVLSGEELKGGE